MMDKVQKLSDSEDVEGFPSFLLFPSIAVSTFREIVFGKV
jgi:hypothetical protein